MLFIFLSFNCKKGSKEYEVDNGQPEPTVAEPVKSVNINADADAAIEAFNDTFLISEGSSRQYYKTALDNGEKDYFWCQALEIQMMEDVYLRTKSEKHKKLIENLLQTFLAQNQGAGGLKDWNWNEFNDDILWAGIAFARGYQITGNSLFLNQAEYAFNRAYDRGWDNNLGGGIWWDITKGNKSGLSNNTAVILACYIYESNNNENYLNKAKAIYDWTRSTLLNKSTGAVYENIKSDGTLAMDANVYNVGAFISAANQLHRLTGLSLPFEDAKLAVDYIKNNSVANGIMARRNRNGTWQSEFARGIGEFVRDNNLWDTYYPWMKQNADAAWNAKRDDLKISWNDWINKTPQDDITSALECVSAVVMLQVTPAEQPLLKENAIYRLTPKINAESALEILANSKMGISKWGNLSSQQFKLVAIDHGYYRLLAQNNSANSLAVADGTNINGAEVIISITAENSSQYWKLIYDYDGFYKFKPKCAPLSLATVKNSMANNGTACVLYKEKFQDNERWLLQKTND